MSNFPEPRLLTLPARKGPDGQDEAPFTLAIHERGEGPAVVLCHGFPELSYSWRHQIDPLVEAGFRVIVPDMRGYGASDAPTTAEAYDIEHLTGDMAAMLDVLGIERAVFVGHDWGGFVVWAMPILHPERTAGVIGVNTPYTPRQPIAPTQMMRAVAGDDPDSIYVLWFQKPGEAEGVFEAKTRMLFEKMMRGSIDPAEAMKRQLEAGAKMDMNPFRRLDELEPMGDAMLSEADIDAYVAGYAKNGFFGPVSWYRNFDRNWERQPRIGADKIDLPCLMISAAWDPVLTPAMADGMPALCPDLERHTIEACGHWTMQEKPEELNALLVDWLTRRFGAAG